jgi:mevalonate kinase
MTRDFHANGKIVLSGEYMVLKGAGAIAVPLKAGQQMKVIHTGETGNTIRWTANELNKPWFKAQMNSYNLEILESTDYEVAGKLANILKQAAKLNKHLFADHANIDIITNSEFQMNWGFGSSAALIVNISQWAGVDPFELLFRTTGGSGADVAASLSGGPVLYRIVNNKPIFCRVDFAKQFKNQLWLVYLGKKQDTHSSVSAFSKKGNITVNDVNEIDAITHKMIDATTIHDFMKLMEQHEEILSRTLEVTPVKKMLFSDFEGAIKSLGAWGGDFILAASENQENEVKKYFERKGYYPVFPYAETIL